MANPGQQVVSPLYADRMVIGPLENVLDQSISLTAFGHAAGVRTSQGGGSIANVPQSTNQRFWSTPWRDEMDATREILEIRLSGERPINSIDLMHAHYPHNLTVEWMDSSGAWQPVLNASGQPIYTEFWDSVPYWVNDPNRLRRRPDHPFHPINQPSHWVQENFFFPPVTTTRIRLILRRAIGGHPGVGGPLPGSGLPGHTHWMYPLAVKDLDIGYKIRQVSDIPADAFEAGNSFASTIDLLGSRVQFQVHRERPSDIFQNKTWRCEPQPIPNAVVSFYADVRNAAGESQVIDRFFLDPLYVGPTLNLYYSNDTPSGSFTATDDSLGFPLLQAHGNIPPIVGVEGLDLDGSGPSFLDVSNEAIQFDPTGPFWFGLEVTPHFDSGPIAIHPILDAGPFWLQFESNAVRVTSQRGETVSCPISFSANQRVQIWLAWVPKATDEWEAGLYVAANPVNGDTTIVFIPLIAPFAVTDVISNIRIGGFQDRDPGSPDFTLNSLILKLETLTTETINTYAAIGGSNFTRKPYYQFDPDNTHNALLRFDWNFAFGDNPLGFRGGTGVPYDDVVWTPVARHYQMAKGYMYLPPIRAKFFKFEMSNLVAETYEVFTPMTRTVKVFSSYQVQQWQNQISANPGSTTDPSVPGMATVKTLTYDQRYGDALASLTPNPVTGPYGPTSALYSSSPTTASRLADAHWAYGFQPWQRSQVAPRFQEIGQHVYEQIEVTHKTKLAYFTGLKALQAFRVDYIAADDTDAYDEHFHDTTHIAANTWIMDGNSLQTPNGVGPAYAVAQSVPYGSTRAVKGIQFAAQQTPARLLNANDDFHDNSAAVPQHFEDYGDASSVQGANEAIVTRVAVPTWGDLDGRFFGTDLDLLTYGQIQKIPLHGPADAGGLGTELVTPSDAGRVHAAVRVTAPADLASPLHIQIVSEDEQILASKQINIHAGQTVEDFVGYTIGSVNRAAPVTWGDVAAEAGPGTSYGQLNNYTYGQLQSAPFQGNLRARIVQLGRSADEFRVQALSLFDEGILWEFSNDGGTNWIPAMDIRNNPYGVLIFPDLGTVTPTPRLMWRVRGYRQGLNISALRIRPWYAGLLSGITATRGIAPPGPNVTPYDHYADVLDDPQWKISHDPIPHWWYTGGRPIPPGPVPPVPPAPDADPPPYTPPDDGRDNPIPAQNYLVASDDITMPDDLARTSRGYKSVLARLTENVPVPGDTYQAIRKSKPSMTEDIPLQSDYPFIRITGPIPAFGSDSAKLTSEYVTAKKNGVAL